MEKERGQVTGLLTQRSKDNLFYKVYIILWPTVFLLIFEKEVASKVLGFFLRFVPPSVAQTDQPSPWASGSSSS